MKDDSLNARRAARREMMLEGKLLKVIPIVALPMIVSMLIDALYNMADTYFVSQLDILATSAVGVNDALLHLLRAVALGFGMGASSPISKLLGAKREEDASRVATTSIITAVITLTTLAAITFCFREQVVIFLGATEGAKPFAIDYATFILISAPITAAEVGCSQTLRAEGSTTYSMLGMISGCVINVALDPLFIYTWGMGVAGAALATTISKGISLIVLLMPFFRHKTVIELRFRFFTPKWSIYKEIAKMGIPTILRTGAMSLSAVYINRLARDFGDAALAAVSVSNKCTRLVGSAVLGFGQGFQPIGGYCFGARKYRRFRDAFLTCTIMGGCVAVVIGALMFVFSPNILGIFMDSVENAETMRIGNLMIRTQCVTMFPHIYVMIVNGLFQALGRPKEATVLGLSRQVICLVPAAFILSKLFEVNGLACAQAVADLLSLVISITLTVRQMKVIKSLNEGDEPPAGYGLSVKAGEDS